MSKHVVHIYLETEEFEFLQTCAARLKLSYAQTILHLADFDTRLEEHKRPLPENKAVRVQGVDFSNTPFNDY